MILINRYIFQFLSENLNASVHYYFIILSDKQTIQFDVAIIL